MISLQDKVGDLHVHFLYDYFLLRNFCNQLLNFPTKLYDSTFPITLACLLRRFCFEVADLEDALGVLLDERSMFALNLSVIVGKIIVLLQLVLILLLVIPLLFPFISSHTLDEFVGSLYFLHILSKFLLFLLEQLTDSLNFTSQLLQLYFSLFVLHVSYAELFMQTIILSLKCISLAFQEVITLLNLPLQFVDFVLD